VAALVLALLVFCDANVITPLRMGAGAHFAHTPYQAAMDRMAKGHHAHAARHLTEDACTVAKRASGWPIDGCNSADLAIDAPAPRQIINADGSITQMQTLTLNAATGTGKRVCGCAGISQSGNRPGTGGSWSRAAVFDVRAIQMFNAELVMWLPPNNRCVRLGVCEQPALAAQQAAAITTAASSYQASIEAVYAALVADSGPGRRALATDPAALSDLTDETGVLPPDAPLHPWALTQTMAKVLPLVIVGRTAAIVDAPMTTSARAAAARRAFMMDLVDPSGDLHSMASVLGNSTLEDTVAQMPYVDPATWHASRAKVGDHLGARILWATTVASSHAMHERFTSPGRVLRAPPRPSGATFLTTLQEQPELQALEDQAHPYHGDTAETWGRGPTSGHPSRKLARRDLSLAVAAIALSLVALTASVACLVMARRLSARIDNVEAVLDSAKTSLDGLRNDAVLLNKRLDTTTDILASQGNQLANAQAGITGLQQWQGNLSSSLQDVTDRAAQLSALNAQAARDSEARSRATLTAIQDSNTILNNALNLTATTATEGLATLASTIAESHAQVMTALANVQQITDAALAGTYTRALGNARALETLAKVFRIIVSREALHDTLTSSVYTTTTNLEASGWRPFWGSAALASENRPQDPDRWGPGSPLRTVIVDTVLVVRTARSGPGPDSYAGTNASVANSVFSATHVAVEDALTLACDSAKLLTLGVLTSASADAIVGNIGPPGCIPPFTGTIDQYLGNFTGPGAMPFNPTSRPLCTCWVTHRRSTCPVVLANATSPLLTLVGLRDPGVARGPGARLTMLGIAGVQPRGVGTSPSDLPTNTPCAVLPGSPPTLGLTVAFVHVLDSQEALTGVLVNATCATPGTDAPSWRNVTSGRATLGVPPEAVTSDLAEAYVFSLRTTVGDLASSGGPIPGTTPALGRPLAPNPRTNPRPNVAGSRDLCGADPSITTLYTWRTVATSVHAAFVTGWDAIQGTLRATRAALNGVPHPDMTTSEEPNNYDPLTHSRFPCIYAEYAAIQDGTNVAGTRLPTVPWIPVYKVTYTGTYARGRVFMPAVPPTQPGATNGIPAYTYTTDSVLSSVAMPNSLGDTFTLVGDLEGCIRNNCTVNFFGSLFGTPTNTTARYLYNAPTRDLGLAPQATLTENTLGYIADRNVTKINGTYVHKTRPFLKDTWTAQRAPYGSSTWKATASCATITPYFRQLFPVTGDAAVSLDDVICDDAAAKAEDGDMCHGLKYNGMLRPALAGTDADLAGTPAAACGTGSTLCFSARNAVHQVLQLEVPAGEFTTTLQAACPEVDTDLQGLGLASITVRAPKDALFPTTWSYRFVCGGLDPTRDDTEAPGYAESAAATCAAASRAAANAADANSGAGGLAFVPGPLLDPGSVTTLPMTSPISNWTLDVATTDPTTGLPTVKCRGNTFSRVPLPTLGAFGDTIINLAPVINNTAALDLLANISAVQDAYTAATADVSTLAALKEQVLVASQVTQTSFSDAIRNITQAAIDAGAINAASVEDYLATSSAILGTINNASASIQDNFTAVTNALMQSKRDLNANANISAAAIQALAENSSRLRQQDAINFQRLANLSREQQEQFAKDELNFQALQNATDRMRNESTSLLGAFGDALSDAADAAKDIANTVVDLVESAFSWFAIPNWIFVVVGGAVGGFAGVAGGRFLFKTRGVPYAALQYAAPTR